MGCISGLGVSSTDELPGCTPLDVLERLACAERLGMDTGFSGISSIVSILRGEIGLEAGIRIGLLIVEPDDLTCRIGDRSRYGVSLLD